MTPAGILTKYKKQINLTAEDIVQKDYWEQFNRVHEDTARRMKETKPEQFTKEMELRLRLGRDVNAPFEKDGHEYGNYDKYHKQSVEVEEEDGAHDDGQMKFFRNY